LELVAGGGFPYGYRKLTVCLKEDYKLKINKKKVYRLCKELDILRPQGKIKKIRPKKLQKRINYRTRSTLADGLKIWLHRWNRSILLPNVSN